MLFTSCLHNNYTVQHTHLFNIYTNTGALAYVYVQHRMYTEVCLMSTSLVPMQFPFWIPYQRGGIQKGNCMGTRLAVNKLSSLSRTHHCSAVNKNSTHTYTHTHPITQKFVLSDDRLWTGMYTSVLIKSICCSDLESCISLIKR